jgi:hypothetical protein
VTPSEALQHICTLVEASAELKDDTQRKVLLRSVVMVAQKGLGVVVVPQRGVGTGGRTLRLLQNEVSQNTRLAKDHRAPK